jgi:hypothetical protein
MRLRRIPESRFSQSGIGSKSSAMKTRSMSRSMAYACGELAELAPLAFRDLHTIIVAIDGDASVYDKLGEAFGE